MSVHACVLFALVTFKLCLGTQFSSVLTFSRDSRCDLAGKIQLQTEKAFKQLARPPRRVSNA